MAGLDQISFGRIRSAEQKQRVIWTDPKRNVTYLSIGHNRTEMPIKGENGGFTGVWGGVAVDEDCC